MAQIIKAEDASIAAKGLLKISKGNRPFTREVKALSRGKNIADSDIDNASAHHVPDPKPTINNADSDKDAYSKSFLSVLKQLVDNVEANHEMMREMMEARFDDQDKRITEMGASLGYMSSQINKVLQATKTSSAGGTGAGTSASTSATSQQQRPSSETETETFSGFVTHPDGWQCDICKDQNSLWPKNNKG